MNEAGENARAGATRGPGPGADAAGGAPTVCFGFDHETDEGSFMPNGVPPADWPAPGAADLENPLPGVHFRHSRLLHFLKRAGVNVRREKSERLAASARTWFYPLRPFGVPELGAAFGGLSPAVRREVESGRCYLLVDYAHEGYSRWMFERVYEALRRVPLPPEQVVLISGDLNAGATHARYVVEHGITRPVRVHALNYFRNVVADYMATPEFRESGLTWQQVEAKRERARLYLNFNRRNRLHRVLAAVRLHRRGLLGRGYVSLPDSFEGQTNERAAEDEGARFGVSAALMRELREGYPQLRPLLPLRVDVEEVLTNHAHTHPTWPYSESWLSLVSESLFFESAPGQVFFSEKIWKPMMNYHPFLLLGDAHSLAALRGLGFRTFHPHLDESYDGVADHERRFRMVIDELERVSRMPEAELYDWFMGMKEVLVHNHEWLRAGGFDPAFVRIWDSYVGPSGEASGRQSALWCDRPRRVDMRQKVGFVGLGKLGLPCAEVMGRAHDVCGFDPAAKATRNVRMVDTIAEAVDGKDLVFIAVPTPHEREYDGSVPTSGLPARDFDYAVLKQVLTDIAPHVHAAQDVVVISTVLPGTCRRELAPLLPRGRLLYNPYFIAMGTVENDFLAPEFVIIGSSTGGEGEAAALVDFYKSLVGEQQFHTGTWEEAEATKIFYNTFISFKLSFVNMIQDVAVRLGHMDVDKVTGALSGAKKRLVSGMYMKAGMGDGGPCHPRDNIALRALADRMDLGYDLFSAILRCREGQAENMARFLREFGHPVVIMGKSFKPGVPYVDGSYSLLVAHYVAEAHEFAGFIDPLTGDDVDEAEPLTYLLAHRGRASHRHRFFPGSVIVDPWRECPEIERCTVIHYGGGREGLRG
ncbi:MAG TPA: hypothetical protein VGX48_23310 [Pyrinomonadaceae bacterium]|jgi:UDPglucose 6-dehydrogenase|nr:hypothetical protein [Pyrinomonadaceae bacterium]